MATRVTQQSLQVVSQPTPLARVTEAVAQVVAQPAPLARITTTLAQVVSTSASILAPARITHLTLQLAAQNYNPSLSRVTHTVAQVVSRLATIKVTAIGLEVFGNDDTTRVLGTQIAAEAALQFDGTSVQVTQESVETALQFDGTRIKATHIGVEILKRFTCVPSPPPPAIACPPVLNPSPVAAGCVTVVEDPDAADTGCAVGIVII